MTNMTFFPFLGLNVGGFRMEEFYKVWFDLQQKRALERGDKTKSTDQTHQNDESESGHSNKSDNETDPTNASQIVYENDEFKLSINKSFFKRQRNFRLQDHLFHIRLITKSATEPPLLTDILDFLHAGFIHILDEIKIFYSEGKYLLRIFYLNKEWRIQ